MNQKQFDFDLDFQQDLLTLLLKKPTLAHPYMTFLKAEHFGKIIHQDLYTLILQHQQKYGKMPTQNALGQECINFLKEGLGKPDTTKYQATIKAVFSSQVAEETYVLSLVADFIREKLALEAIIRYSQKDIDLQTLHTEIGDIRQIGGDPEQKKQEMLEEGLFFNDLMKKELPKAKFYIGRGLMPTTGYVILAGYAKRGKTTLATQMSLCLVNALPFLEYFPIEEKVRVLYLASEGNLAEFQNRFRQEVTGLRLKGFKVNASKDDFRYQQVVMNILSETGQQKLEDLVQMFRPQVTVIDPVSKFTGSQDLNKMEQVTKFVNILDEISLKQNCVWLLLHHNKKPQEKQSTDPIYQIIGSSAWANLCQSFMGLRRIRKDTLNRKVLTFEMRQAETPDPMYLWQNEARIHELISKDEKVRKNIRAQDLVNVVNSLGGHASWKTIMRQMKAEHGLNSTLGTVQLTR